MMDALRVIQWASLCGDALLLAIFLLLLAALERRPEGKSPETEARREADRPSPEADAGRVEREDRDAWRTLQAYDADVAYGVRNAETGDGG